MNRIALTLSLIAVSITGAAAVQAETSKKAQKHQVVSSNTVAERSKAQVPANGTTRSASNGRNDQGCRNDRKRCAANLFGLSGVEVAAPAGQQAAFGHGKGNNGQAPFGNGKGSNAQQPFGNAKGSNAPQGYKVGSPPAPTGYPTGAAPVHQGYSTGSPTPAAPPTGGHQGVQYNNNYNGGDNSGGVNNAGDAKAKIEAAQQNKS